MSDLFPPPDKVPPVLALEVPVIEQCFSEALARATYAALWRLDDVAFDFHTPEALHVLAIADASQAAAPFVGRVIHQPALRLQMCNAVAHEAVTLARNAWQPNTFAAHVAAQGMEKPS